MDRGMTSGLRCLFFFAYRRGQHEGTILNRRENTISVYLILQLTVIAHSIIYFFSYSSKSLSTFRIKFCIFFFCFLFWIVVNFVTFTFVDVSFLDHHLVFYCYKFWNFFSYIVFLHWIWLDWLTIWNMKSKIPGIREILIPYIFDT